MNKMNKALVPPDERLIVALDFPAAEPARAFVAELGETVRFYKLGLELFLAAGYPLLDWLVAQNKKVFLDLKFFDIPQTVGAAVAQVRDRGATFITVHGNDGMLQAAADNKGSDLKVLAVTALTSLDQADLRALGFACDVKTLVLSRAERALACGCDGVVASGLEAEALRAAVGNRLVIVTPGIRPVQNDDDQKRTVDVASAFRNGADYIVMGRPLRLAERPREQAQEVLQTIAELFD